MKQESSSLSLNIGVVGAGLAGLAAAAALAKNGHSVEIFERSAFASEIGAAINVCPNAARILSRWDFDFDRWQPYMAQATRISNIRTDKTLAYVSYHNLESRFGQPYYLYHRADLHSGLKELALGSKGQASNSKLRLSSEVIDIEYENATLKLKGGETIYKDMVIVADGVHSRFVHDINGRRAEAKDTGMCSYRWLIPNSKMVSNPLLKQLLDKYSKGIEITYAASETRLVWYPCRGGELWNFNGIHPAKPNRSEVENWTAEGSVNDLVSTYEEFGPLVLEACRQAEDLKLWKLVFREPLQSWVRGKTALIGDAAHPMLPHQGQGGAQGIEDGAALGALFAKIHSYDDINERLKLFQDVRYNHTASVQCLSNVGYDKSHNAEKLLKRYIHGPVPKTFEEVQDYIYGHDVVFEAAVALDTIESQSTES